MPVDQAFVTTYIPFCISAGRRPQWFMGTLLELRKRGAAKTHQMWARVSDRLKAAKIAFMLLPPMRVHNGPHQGRRGYRKSVAVY